MHVWMMYAGADVCVRPVQARRSPAWRTSVACMRVIAWLEAGEKLEQEMAAEEAKAGRSGMEGHGEGGMAGEDGIAGTSAFLARN